MTIAITSMAEAHDEVTGNIRTHSDLINLPPFGHPDNYAYGMAQFNVAAAQERTEGMIKYLVLGQHSYTRLQTCPLKKTWEYLEVPILIHTTIWVASPTSHAITTYPKIMTLEISIYSSLESLSLWSR